MSYPQLLTPEEKLAQGKAALGIRDVVVLCGSMRFADDMVEVAIEESVAGALVLKPDCNMKIAHPLWADPVEAEALKVRLDDQHKQKIRLADRVIVVGDYIGDSTRGEIAYARKLGRPIRFTHPEVDPAVADTQPEAATTEESPVVAHGTIDGRTLLCLRHERRPGLLPIWIDDLDDGGICTECGADVLIPAVTEGPTR